MSRRRLVLCGYSLPRRAVAHRHQGTPPIFMPDTVNPANTIVSIARLNNYDPVAVEEALVKLLAPLGGMEAFVGHGDRAVLKPNFLFARPRQSAVCTDPEIIRSVARATAAAGASTVTVTDSPGVGTARRCARQLGLLDNESFDVVNVDKESGITPKGTEYHQLFLSRQMVEADALINLSKAKTHGQMLITAAVKNTFGAVIGLEKAQWHYRSGKDPMDFARLIVHIHCAIEPRLNILEAVIGMEGNGPGSGDPRRLGFLMASTNAHALDHTLCRILEIDPNTVPTLAVAKEMGLLPPLDRIEIAGTDPDSLHPHPPWKPARPHLIQNMVGPGWITPVVNRLMALRPNVDHSKCVVCGQCIPSCGAKAMEIVARGSTSSPRLEIDKKKCISCFCCQEICPEGAITIRAGLAARLLGLGTR